MKILKVNTEINESDCNSSVYDLITSIINKSNDKFFCVNSVSIEEQILFEKEKGFVSSLI